MSLKNIFKSISKIAQGFRPEPYQVVVLVILFFLVGGFLVRVRRGDGDSFNATVLYNDTDAAEKNAKKQVKKEYYQTGEYDANLKYAERVREASSISLGLSLFLLRERVIEQKTSVSINEILTRFDSHELKPPGVTLQPTVENADYGLLRTTRGLYLLRYRPKPFVLEVLACGTNGMPDGAIFILRVPDQARPQIVGGDSSQVVASWAVLYVAPEKSSAWIPPAFSPSETFVNSGWRLEPLQANDVSPEKLQALNRFLAGR